MIETILTPTALWKNFILPDSVDATVIQERKRGNIAFSKLYIEGRKVGDKNVKIYAELVRNVKSKTAPAIILLEDFEIGQDKKLIKSLLSNGYTVLSIDLYGKKDGSERHTVYPEQISYANFELSKDKLYTVEKSAQQTCWYEWCAVLRYALKYLKSLPFIDKVGAFGCSKVATALWQVAGTDSNLDCASFALNSGWIGYKEIFKFGGMVEPKFSDQMYKFIAGVDSQSYALQVKCPTLLLSATNDLNFDVDRAYDTLSKIPDSVFRAMHYSVNMVDRVNNDAFNNLLTFFDKFLLDEKTELPKESEIKCEIKDGKFLMEIDVEEIDQLKAKKVNFYVAEQKVNPATRCWLKLDAKKVDKNKYACEYQPFYTSDLLTCFATIEFSNGFKASTNILGKRFKQEEVAITNKSNVLYSSRIVNAESVFAPLNNQKENALNIDVSAKGKVEVKKGPMDIMGVGCSRGLNTFAVSSQKYQPVNNSLIMLDVFVKENAQLTVKFIVDVLGDKKEYFATVNLLGGDVWHNVQFAMNKFKTVEGLVLKEFSKVDALQISVNGSEYLVNNLLWV